MSLASNIQELYSQNLLDLLVKIGQIASKMSLKAYVVGGFVRDLLLERANYDIDIMVEGDAIPFATAVGQELQAECKLIERFHTAHIYLQNLTIDFSSARKEFYRQPGALPEVSFSSIQDDLFRRDFTINAMAIDISPDNQFELIDLFNGKQDLDSGIIKILHARSFLDDPTRLYRALRFADRFKFILEPKTEMQFDKAIKLSYPSFLSKKRIAAEIDKAFSEKRPLSVLSKYQNTGLLTFYHRSFVENARPDFKYSVIPATITRLSSKFKDISESAVFWSFFLSNIPLEEAKELIINSGLPHAICSQATSAIETWKDLLEKLILAKNKIDIYNTLKNACPESIALMYLKNKDKEVENKLNLYSNELYFIKPSITGKDLIDLGIEPGPQIRLILDKIIEKKLEGVDLDRKGELDLARTISNI